jgi:hypothetical protein
MAPYRRDSRRIRQNLRHTTSLVISLVSSMSSSCHARLQAAYSLLSPRKCVFRGLAIDRDETVLWRYGGGDCGSFTRRSRVDGAPLASFFALGYGGFGTNPIEFYLPDERDTDSGFLKVFLTTTYVDMANVAQSPISEVASSRVEVLPRRRVDLRNVRDDLQEGIRPTWQLIVRDGDVLCSRRRSV